MYLVLKLRKCLSGLKQAPRMFFEKRNAGLLKCGFEQSDFDPFLFMKFRIICIVYADDTICALVLWSFFSFFSKPTLCCNFLNIVPCNGFVKKTEYDFYFSFFILSVTKKYLTFICLVLFELDVHQFLLVVTCSCYLDIRLLLVYVLLMLLGYVLSIVFSLFHHWLLLILLLWNFLCLIYVYMMLCM